MVDEPYKPKRQVLFEIEAMQRYDYALTDALMWLSGFEAGGNNSYPGDIRTLRELRDIIRKAIKE